MAFLISSNQVFMVVSALFCLFEGALGKPQMTWYYRGSELTSNTTINLNAGDTFVAQCKGAGNAEVLDTKYIDIYVTKSAPAKYNTVRFTDNTPGIPAKAFISEGQTVYNNYEGIFTGFDHWIVGVYVFELPITGSFGLALVQVSIPTVTTGDSGTYYCAFYDGSENDYSETSFAYTVGLTLNIMTKSASKGRNLASTNTIGYSFALISAHKIIY